MKVSITFDRYIRVDASKEKSFYFTSYDNKIYDSILLNKTFIMKLFPDYYAEIMEEIDKYFYEDTSNSFKLFIAKKISGIQSTKYDDVLIEFKTRFMEMYQQQEVINKLMNYSIEVSIKY